MNDRKLLELAAKAAEMNDLEHGVFGLYKVLGVHEGGQKCLVEWNPLTNDGDALRLAVELEMQVVVGYRRIEACILSDSDESAINAWEPKEGDLCAVTRRAIVRAAAEIGRGWNERLL